MSESKHIDVYFELDGRRYYVGHGDVPYSKDIVKVAGAVSTLLHELAWDYEENARELATFRPRKAWNRSGDFFYEVEPGKFVSGMSYDDAVESYKTFGGASTLQMLSQAFPDGIRVDFV